MKCHILSDLHLNCSNYAIDPLPFEEADVIVFAGDIDENGTSVEQIAHITEGFNGQIVFVPGNHCYWDHYKVRSFEETREKFRQDCKLYGIHGLLDPADHVVIGGKVFMGGTLWTNFSWAETKGFGVKIAMRVVEMSMNDYRCIRRKDGRFTALYTQHEYYKCLAGMEEVYDEHPDKEFVVVTHMPPSEKATDIRYLRDPVTAGYVNCLENWTKTRPNIKLWVSGHCHTSAYFRMGECEFFSNPRGYSKYGINENQKFDPTLIVEI